MKRIGILSMQKVKNYGSFLQAYALKKIIESLGDNEVTFIDIVPGRQLVTFKKSIYSKLGFRSRLSRVFPSVFKQKAEEGKFRDDYLLKFEKFFKILELDRTLPTNEYDKIVIGSDEVFNCCQSTKWGFTTQLYGDIPNARSIISYAGSFGNSTIDRIESLGLIPEIKNSMNHLDAISVRDENSAEITSSLLGVNPIINVDPVLVYGFKSEISPQIKHQEKYMLIYSYPGRLKSDKEIHAILEIANKKNLLIYSLVCKYPWADKAILPDNPIDVLGWFRDAECIVTDTFHGTIFSVITNSIFVTLIRDSNRNKLTSLLNVLGLNSRAVSAENMAKIMEENIDYENVESLLEKHREKALNYLSANL